MKNLKKYIFGTFAILAFLSCEKEEITPAITPQGNVQENAVSNSVGQGGSLAQFTIIDEYMYTLDNKSIKVFNLTNATNPQLVNTVNLGYGIETIHANNGNLFIGTNDGVRIVDATDPVNIVEVSEFEHVTSCDPVVANPDFAFSTLRGGTVCGGNNNQLDIIDIADISNPTLRQSIELVNPFGLGLDLSTPNILYVCDGTDGLKVYDISNTDDIQLVKHYQNIYSKDVISTENGTLIILGLSAIYQYDSTDPLDLKVTSEILI